MKERIRIGSKVSTETWQFGGKVLDDCDSWSFKVFGGNWRDSSILGTARGETGKKGGVLLEKDNFYSGVFYCVK